VRRHTAEVKFEERIVYELHRALDVRTVRHWSNAERKERTACPLEPAQRVDIKRPEATTCPVLISTRASSQQGSKF
jgi:hypothetical protein